MGIRSFIKQRVKDRISGSPATTPSPARSRPPLPTSPSADGFIAVVHDDGIEVGRGRTVVVHGEAVAIFHSGSGWFAIDDACTHEDAPLGEGALDGEEVICPYHDWRYNIRTGACETDPSRPVGCFATRVADGFVWVGPRTADGTQDRGGDHADGLKTTEPLR